MTTPTSQIPASACFKGSTQTKLGRGHQPTEPSSGFGITDGTPPPPMFSWHLGICSVDTTFVNSLGTYHFVSAAKSRLQKWLRNVSGQHITVTSTLHVQLRSRYRLLTDTPYVAPRVASGTEGEREREKRKGAEKKRTHEKFTGEAAQNRLIHAGEPRTRISSGGRAVKVVVVVVVEPPARGGPGAQRKTTTTSTAPLKKRSER